MPEEVTETKHITTKSQELAQSLGSQIINVRSRRRDVERQWLYAHAMWHARRVEERQFYRSNDWKVYVPVGRRAIERITSRATQILLPKHHFFEVQPGDVRDLANSQQADSVRSYLEYLLFRKLHIRRLVSSLVRTFLLYQKAIVKVSIKVDDSTVQWGGYNEHITEIWPTARAVDPFSFYIWPETVEGLDESSLVFEDVMLPWGDYEKAVSQKLAVPISQDELGTPEWPYHHTERLAHRGITEPTAVPTAASGPNTGQKFVSLTEAWHKVEGRWAQCWLVWNLPEAPRLVRFTKSPYPRPPYREAVARVLPGEHYTPSLADDVEALQALFTDQLNQAEEARSIAALPPIPVDELAAPRRDLLVWGPRRFWPINGTDGLKPLVLPDTSSSSGRALQMSLGLINSLAGGGGFVEGQPTRGLPRAGFAVTSLINLATADIKDIAEVLEQEILSPLLADLYQVTMAFVPREQIIKIPGTQAFPPRAVSVADLIGSWDFHWVGAQQIQDQETRSQALIQAGTLLAKLEESLGKEGVQIVWSELVRMVWRDALGERGIDRILREAPQQGSAPGGVAELMAQLGGGNAGMGGGQGIPGNLVAPGEGVAGSM